LKIMFVAGEASGDHHAAALIREIKRMRPEARCFGMGGREMAAAGMDLRLDLASKGVIGFVEVVKHLGYFRRALSQAEALLREERPELLVLVDYPGFNLRLAEKAKGLGIKICYYISPQVWAWKKGRVPVMARLLNKMLVTFPFEKAIYDQAGLACAFVGNPLVDLVKPSLDRDAARGRLGVAAGEELLGLLPGSREQEVSFLLPVMLKSAALMAQRRPGLRFVVIKAPQLPQSVYDKAMAGDSSRALLFEGASTGEAYAVRAACDFALVASGTATLETAMLKVPFVIVYRVNPLSFSIAKRLVKIHSIGLANVVAGRRVVPELLQDELNPRRLAEISLGFLSDPALGRSQVEELAPSLQGLGGPGVAGRAASEALALL
jgi:lipid-A-disaccharide synthase